jgi:hypothetical protein
MKKEYNTGYYDNPSSLIFRVILFSVIIIGMLIYIGRINGSKSFAVFISILIPVAFLVILISVKGKLIKRAVLNFDSSTFTIKIYKLKSDELISMESFLWRDIDSYRFYFDTKKNTCLTLYLKDKRRKTFIFQDSKAFDEAVNQESVFSNFYSYVTEFNKGENKIMLKPGFLTTSVGKLIIVFEVALLSFALLLHLIKNNFSSSYYLLLGIGFIIPQIINRMQNKAIYDKISKLS